MQHLLVDYFSVQYVLSLHVSVEGVSGKRVCLSVKQESVRHLSVQYVSVLKLCVTPAWM